MGWQELKNGGLLVAEEAGFELLLTCDQNLIYQQNLTHRKIALLVLSTNQWPTIQPHVEKIIAAIDLIDAGQVIRVEVG